MCCRHHVLPAFDHVLPARFPTLRRECKHVSTKEGRTQGSLLKLTSLVLTSLALTSLVCCEVDDGFTCVGCWYTSHVSSFCVR